MRKGKGLGYIFIGVLVLAAIQWFEDNLWIIILVGALLLVLIIWLVTRKRGASSIDPDKALDLNCSRLMLPTKILRILNNNGIHTVRALAEAYNSGELSCIYGIGEKSMSEIYNALQRVSAFEALERESDSYDSDYDTAYWDESITSSYPTIRHGFWNCPICGRQNDINDETCICGEERPI